MKANTCDCFNPKLIRDPKTAALAAKLAAEELGRALSEQQPAERIQTLAELLEEYAYIANEYVHGRDPHEGRE